MHDGDAFESRFNKDVRAKFLFKDNQSTRPVHDSGTQTFNLDQLQLQSKRLYIT